MFSYTCIECENVCKVKNRPRKNRTSGLCKICSRKKAAARQVKVTEDGMKLCKKCNNYKPAETDYFLKDKKGYFYSYCRECKKEYLRSRKNISPLTKEEIHETKTSLQKVDPDKKWAKHLLNSSRHCAKRHGREFNIDVNYILELYEKQNHKCYWYGIQLESSTISKYPAKPSIDRLDNDKGYIKGNIVISCMAANYGRNSCDTQIFESFCKLLRK
jgi:hypothetical protein